MMLSMGERWGHYKSSGRKLRPQQGFLGQGFLTDGRRWPWGSRKGEAELNREVSSEEAEKMVGLVTVPRTQEERTDVGGRGGDEYGVDALM